LTCLSISLPDPPSFPTMGSIMTGTCRTEAGKSHSWLMPTSRSAKSRAATTSVAPGISEQILIVVSISCRPQADAEILETRFAQTIADCIGLVKVLDGVRIGYRQDLHSR